MDFDYNEKELELFERIIKHTQKLLKGHYNDEVEISVKERYRKFNFSVEVKTSSFTNLLHVKSFFYEIRDDETIIAEWVGPVIGRTRSIYELFDKYDLSIPVPNLVLIDDEMNLIITEMVEGTGLHVFLLENDTEPAREGMLLMAKTLANLHGITYQMQDDFIEIHKKYVLSVDQTLSWVRWNSESLEKLPDQLYKVEENTLSLVQLTDLVDNLKKIKDIALNSRFISLVNSDPCPDNLLIENSKMTMIDLDTFSFYYFFIDVYYLWTRISCWCVGELSDNIIDVLEMAYIEEFRKYQNITDQEFHFHTILGGLMWVSVMLPSMFRTIKGTLSLDWEENWGRSSMKSRFFSRLEQLDRRIQQKSKYIPTDYKSIVRSIAQTLLQIRDDMAKRHPPVYIPEYPALRETS